MTTTNAPGGAHAGCAAMLRIEDVPEPGSRRAEDLFLDWFGATLAGKGARPHDVHR